MALELAPTVGTATIIVRGAYAVHELLSKLAADRIAFYFEPLLRSEYQFVVDATVHRQLFSFMSAAGIEFAAAIA